MSVCSQLDEENDIGCSLSASELFTPHPLLQMAHYANDCWDGEIETSYGWVECVGLADRSAYDLTAHAKMSKIELTAHEKFAEPRMVDQLKVPI